MHYRAGPGRRPIHTFEAVSDLPRSVVAAALIALAASASVVMLGRIGADLYCTRNQDGPRCVVHQHFVGRTTAVRAAGGSIDRDQRRTSIEVRGLHHGEGVRAAFEVSVPTEPLVFDARFYRDSIDAPLRRGRWLTGRAAFEDAALQFHEGGSPGYFVRERSGLAPVTVGASLSLAVFSAAILAFVTARRRRFRLVFDPNSETVRVSQGTLFKLEPEREVKLSTAVEPTVHLAGEGAQLRSGEQLLLSSSDAREYGLLDSLRRAMEGARSPDARASTPPPAWRHAIAPSIVAALSLTLIAFSLRHLRSVPSDQGTIELHASQRCNYGGVTIMPGGSMAWSARAGTHTIQRTSAQGQPVAVHAQVSPDRTTHIECDASLFAQGPSVQR